MSTSLMINIALLTDGQTDRQWEEIVQTCFLFFAGKAKKAYKKDLGKI